MENDAMLRAMFAAHAITAVSNHVDVRNASATASAAWAIADAMLVEHQARRKQDEELRPRDHWGRPF